MYLRPERLTQDLPTLRLLTRSVEVIRGIAEQLLPATQQAVAPRFLVDVVALQSQIGSGSLPVERLPSAGLALALRAVERYGTFTRRTRRRAT